LETYCVYYLSYEGMTEKREPLRLYKNADDQICNLYLKVATLTDDHVPTKGWGNVATK